MSSKKVRSIAYTGLFLALLLVVQFATKSLGQLVTGSAVNCLLIAAALIAGIGPGIAVAVLSPFFAAVLGIAAAPYPIVPVIAIGNIVLVVTYCLLFQTFASTSLPQRLFTWGSAILAGALLKFLVLFLGITKLLLPMLSNIPAQNAAVLANTFGVTQFFTACIGGVIGALIIPRIKNAMRK